MGAKAPRRTAGFRILAPDLRAQAVLDECSNSGKTFSEGALDAMHARQPPRTLRLERHGQIEGASYQSRRSSKPRRPAEACPRVAR
jgi:hypothetical protein